MNSRKPQVPEYVQNGCGTVLPRGDEHSWQKEHAAALDFQKKQIGARLAVLRPGLTALIEQLQQNINEAMLLQGFWAEDQDNFASKTALVHSELSEMLEANRKGIEADDKIPEFTGEEAEAADTIIRLLDMAGRYNWRLAEAVVAKMHFNLSRPYKHGKKY